MFGFRALLSPLHSTSTPCSTRCVRPLGPAQPAVFFSRSAADPAACAVVAVYNITWDSGRFKKKQDDDSVAQDLQKTLNEFEADLVLLSE